MAGFFLSVPFEERFVKFENTKSIPFSILRIFGGIAVYLVLNQLLKIPFTKEFLNSGVMSAYIIRAVRYMIVVFVMLAVYPMCFGIRKKK